MELAESATCWTDASRAKGRIDPLESAVLSGSITYPESKGQKEQEKGEANRARHLGDAYAAAQALSSNATDIEGEFKFSFEFALFTSTTTKEVKCTKLKRPPIRLYIRILQRL